MQMDAGDIRFGIDLVEETPAVVLVEYSGEAPGLFLEGLNVLNLDDKDVSWFGCIDFERTGQIVYLGEIDIPHVIGAVIVADLPAGPVHTFDLDNFSVLDGTDERDYSIDQRRDWIPPG